MKERERAPLRGIHYHPQLAMDIETVERDEEDEEANTRKKRSLSEASREMSVNRYWSSSDWQ